MSNSWFTDSKYFEVKSNFKGVYTLALVLGFWSCLRHCSNRNQLFLFTINVTVTNDIYVCSRPRLRYSQTCNMTFHWLT